MELPGVTVYVWATSMEKAIIELAQGNYYSSRKEAVNGVHLRLEGITIWEVIIRRLNNTKPIPPTYPD